jgi:hypothetical protein
MLKRIALTTLAAAATFTTAALAPSAITPAAAQGFSIYFGSPQPRHYPPPHCFCVPVRGPSPHGRRAWVNGHWRYQQPAWNSGWNNGWNNGWNGWNPGWGWGRD